LVGIILQFGAYLKLCMRSSGRCARRFLEIVARL
jgi:hypothetical protein